MSERNFLSYIRSRQHASGLIELAAGDDLAVFRPPPGEKLLVGVDQIIAGVHFVWPGTDLRDVGRKVVGRNLSDVAAMAAVPFAMVVCLALPKSFTDADARRLYDAIHDEAARFGCPIIGGDTGSHDGPLVASVTILARSGGVEPVTRRGAKVGDKLYVTGPLGGSLLGRHLRIEPRLDLARTLAATGKVHAMIDLSDGLSLDAARLAEESGVGLRFDAERIPIHADAIERSRTTGTLALDHALNDGEDHELLLAGDAIDHPMLVEVGTVVAGSGIMLIADGIERPLQARGWEHPLG